MNQFGGSSGLDLRHAVASSNGDKRGRSAASGYSPKWIFCSSDFGANWTSRNFNSWTTCVELLTRFDTEASYCHEEHATHFSDTRPLPLNELSPRRDHPCEAITAPTVREEK